MKKLIRCPICGCKGEDLVFIFICSSPNCQNYRKDIEPIISDDDSEKENLNFSWPPYEE